MSDPRDAMFTTPAMAAAFAPEAHMRRLLAFEAALARAEARAGVIPPQAAAAIGAACGEPFDVPDLYRSAALAGTLAIPLVQAIEARVGAAGRGFVHWGATSQDALDTAVALQMRDGLALLEADLLRLCAACAALAAAHRRTPMAGRTLLQQASPISFGLKAARWLAMAARQVRALREQRRHALVVQLGGAAGTLAALGERGLVVAELLAEELGLAAPDLPWHAERDRVAGVAAQLGVAAGAAAKVAQDIALLAQTEVAEAREGAAEGKGGSSAMPQKRNPTDAALALAAARLAQAQVPVLLASMAGEHERAAGAWQAEWQALPDLFRYTAGAVARAADAAAGLEVDAERMRANLGLDGGLLMAEALTMALAPALGRPGARRAVQSACARATADGLSLAAAAAAEPAVRGALSEAQIGEALDPERYLGSSEALIDRALASYNDLGAGDQQG